MVSVIGKLLVGAALLLRGAAHPIHSTLTELRYDERTLVAELSVRVFADDLVGDRAAYVTRAIGLTSRDGRAAPLEGCGERRSGDVIWFCLRARLAGGLRGARITNALLFERFSDQINVVQVTSGSAKATMLFVKGDATRTLGV